MTDITLNQLFMPDFSQSPEVILGNIHPKSDLDSIHKAVEQHISEGSWNSIQKEILSHLESMLDISLGKILANSWATYSKIKKVLNTQKQKGNDDIALVSLVEHSIKSTHEPELKVLLNDIVIQTLPLAITLKLKISGLILKLQHGKIQSIQAGQCKGQGSIKYQGVTLLEKQIMKFDLVANVDLQSTQASDLKTTEQFELFSEAREMPQKTSSHNYQLWLWIIIVLLAYGLAMYWVLYL